MIAQSLILFLGLLATPIFAGTVNDKYLSNMLECLKEYHVPTKDLYKSILPAEMTDNQLCLKRCSYQKLELLDKDNQLDFDQYHELISTVAGNEKKTAEIMECAKKIGKFDTCEKMRNLIICEEKLVE